MSLHHLLAARLRAVLPSFTDGALYLVGSADACAQLLERREDDGTASHADHLLAAVARAVELRLEAVRREDGEVELRAALLEVAAVATAWADACEP